MKEQMKPGYHKMNCAPFKEMPQFPSLYKTLVVTAITVLTALYATAPHHSAMAASTTTANPTTKNKTPATQLNSQWKTLKDCKLVDHPNNDGDSFRARHKGKDYVFRLYLVDCPETKYDFTERILKQMEHFSTTHAKVIQIGEISKEFVKSFLKKPFTVYTKGENALGSGEFPRMYAFVKGSNKKDLGETLLQQGLARSFGKLPSGPKIDPKIKARYDSLEKEAKKKNLGAWSKHKSLKLTTGSSQYLSAKAKKSALENSKDTTERKGKTTESLIRSVKQEPKKGKREITKRPNSIFFATAGDDTKNIGQRHSANTITKRELDIILNKAKEIDSKGRQKNK